jgi:hypothetical protein
MAFLSPSNFTGKYELHTGMYDVTKLQAYIDKYEGRYLRQLFGVDLYNSFMSDIDQQTNEPKSPNFQYIFNPFAEDVTLYSMLDSDGILEMLKGFIFFEYAKDLLNQMTPFGNVRQRAENSTAILALQSQSYNRYNEAIRTFRAIRDYIYLNFDIATGQAVEINVTNQGTTYSGGGSFTPTPLSGLVLTLSVTTPGTGYITNNGVATSGGSGSGLTIDYVDDGAGGVLSATIDNPGTGYKAGDVVTIVDGNDDATITINSATQIITGTGLKINYLANPIGEILITTPLTPGTGYVDATSVATTTTGSGTGCLVNIVTSSGAITAFTLADGGTQYLVGDTLTITGGNADATFMVANVTDGEVTLIIPTLNNLGTGYNVGDLFGIIGDGNDACQFELDYVGIGDLTEYNGIQKALTYWL